MTDIVRYISHKLCNPMAAEKLSDEMIESAEKLTAFPYSNAVHYTIKPLEHEYRKLIVQNYILFYRIDEKEKRVTIVRAIYASRDYENLL